VGKQHHVYKSDLYLDPAEETMPPVFGQPYNILAEDYDDLPEKTQEKFDRTVLEPQRKERATYQAWATKFRDAWVAGEPLPSVKFGSTIRTDTSKEKGEADMTSIAKAYLAVLEAGKQGITSMEARKNGEVGGGISGALTKLHQHGIIVRLKKTR
jgi:hypothetical protein